jgi:hypothetical protein
MGIPSQKKAEGRPFATTCVPFDWVMGLRAGRYDRRLALLTSTAERKETRTYVVTHLGNDTVIKNINKQFEEGYTVESTQKRESSLCTLSF